MSGRRIESKGRGEYPVKRALQGTAVLFTLGFGLASTPAHAVFEDMEFSPRARALGGSYASLSDDASAIFYNPAGLVNLEGMALNGTLFEPYNLRFHSANGVAFAIPTEEWGSFGIGYSDFRVEYLDAVLSIEKTFTFSHAIMLMEDLASSFAVGYNVNIYHLDYPTRSVSGLDLGSEVAMGIDVGFIARLRDRTTAGFFAKNVNAAQIGDPVATDLPQRVSGGIAYRPYDGVITTFEIEKELGKESQFHGGMEFRIAEPLLLRFGSQTKPNLFDVGIGLEYAQVKLDFTYTHHPVLEETFRYGVGLQF